MDVVISISRVLLYWKLIFSYNKIFIYGILITCYIEKIDIFDEFERNNYYIDHI